MKSVYLVQPNNSLSNSLFLPYSVGCIAAYCFDDEEICKNYSLGDLIFTKMPVEQVLPKLENPAVVGFSCYMWNVEYNLLLAEEVKKAYPQAVIVFGGPQVPDDTNFLKDYSFIDVLIHGEGEFVFCSLLKAVHSNADFGEISNISFRKNGELVKTRREQGCDLSELPSPYAKGIFDSIINDPQYADVQFDAIIETNRGCPYRCIYCSWAGTEEAFRKFPYERIESDLNWIAENKIQYCICADSNFGILDRDRQIVDYLVELKKKTGYPQKFETTAAKNKDDLIFEINKKLDSVNLNRGISVAVQSMSPKVLEIVGRKNMSVDNLAEQLARYREAGMFTYTDIILGLPGETFESFSSGLFQVIEAGQHSSININRCEFLPNTLMYSDEYRRKYAIKTIRSFLCQNHSAIAEDLRFGSRSDLVVETSTMSRDDWRRALRLSVCVQSFHCLGLLRFVAIYLRKAKNIAYHDFYSDLFNWIENESKFIKEKLDYVCQSIDVFLEGKGNLYFCDSMFGNVYWPFEEALFLCSACEIEKFYEEFSQYLYCVADLNDEEIIDILNYQNAAINLPEQKEKTLSFKYDWPQYFAQLFNPDVTSPKAKDVTVKVSANGVASWEEYARFVVWYGKREERTINKMIYID